MKRLLLINPVERKSGYLLSRATTFAPLGLAYVAAATPADWTVRLIDEHFEPFEYEPADLVALSSFTGAINRAYEIASVYRAKGTKVVIGGIHASMVPEEAAEHVDAVVVGEVETVWADVLRDFERGSLQRVYSASRVDLATAALRPRRDLLDPRYLWNSVQTSRGCPFDCSFCSVTRYLGREYRQRDPEDVLDELKGISGRYVAFVDDNLIGYSAASRERAKRLFRGMIDLRLRKRWWMQTSINAAEDEEVLALAARSGCMFAFVGFETTKEEYLKEMRKGVNLKIGAEHYRDVIRAFHRHGIAVMGGFIVGNDHESPEYYREFARFLLHSGVDMIQITILTPLPGTRLFDEMKAAGRLIHTAFPDDWRKYRFSWLVHRPLGVSEEDLYRGHNYLKARLYSPAAFAYRMIRSALSLRNPVAFAVVYKFNLALSTSWRHSYYYSHYPRKLAAKAAGGD